MEPVRHVEGRAYPFGRKNVDTDLIIPAKWLKTVTREGLGKGAFEAVRSEEGNVFDDPRHAGAPIIIAGDNFGCGSSREHAPWALLQYGFQAVIAPSFADIFYNNSLKNGLLLIRLDPKIVDRLFGEVQGTPGYRVAVDLEAQTITTPGGESFAFDIEPFTKHCLLNGLDEIGLTLEHAAEIRAFESRHRERQPWLFG